MCTGQGLDQIPVIEAAATDPAASSPISSLPQLSSLPAARAKLYLDFNGNFQSTWGTFSNVSTPVFDQDGNTSSFSAGELSAIQEVWARVAEDFAPFNIDVTTVDPGSQANQVVAHIAIGGNWSDWYGQSAGGVAYIGGFYNLASNVGYVFEEALGNGNPKFVAEAASHEAGHLFGLQHQATWSGGTLVEQYNSGSNGWAPIMGVGYNQPRSTWHNGTTAAGPSSFQDDLSVIAGASNAFGWRSDDYGDSRAAASPLPVSATNVALGGILGSDDRDVWSFSTSGGSLGFQLNPATIGPNLDAVLELLDQAGNILVSANPSTSLGATIAATVGAGTYYLAARSAGGYGNMGQYSITGTLPSGSITAPEIAVQVDSNGISDGGSIQFGSTTVGSPVTKTVTVSNSGSGTLTLTALNASAMPPGYSLVSNLGATSLAPGQSTSFAVRLDAIAAGSFGGTISLANNDSDENPFDMVLQGAVTAVASGGGAEYRLNESGGVTAVDSSGNGFHATYVNAPTLSQSGAITGDTAVSFNGTNQYVALPSGPFGNYGSTSSYTLSFETWFQAPTGASGVILGQTNGGTTPGIGRADSYVPALHLGTDGRLRSSLFWHGNPYARLLTGDGKRYDDGQWHHVAVTYAGGVETLYVDGVAIGQQTVPQSSYAGSYSYYLGTGFTDGWTAGNGGWHFFRGKLDEAAIHGRALSAAEVADHFADGAGTDTSAPEITVRMGTTHLSDGQTALFGSTVQGTVLSQTFTITNDGTSTLVLTPLNAAAMPAGYSLVSNLGASSLAPGQSTSFVVRLDAITAGTFGGTISLANNDSDENPFDLVLQGTVSPVTTSAGAAYRLNESGGTTALDSSGNGHHGTYVNNPSFGQPGALAGDSAVSFNGSNQYVALPSGPFGAYGTSSNYTLSFETWFSAPAGGSGVILGQTNGSATPGVGRADSYVPALQLGTDGRLRSSMFWHGNPYARLVTGDGKRYDDGQWHHVAVTYAGGVETLYVDGVAVGQQSVPQSAYTSSYRYFLGTGFTDGWAAGNGGWHFFRGKLDEAAVHSRALSAAEVAQHYAAGGGDTSAPEISVRMGTTNLGDGQAASFGSTLQGTPLAKTFTVANDGNSTLVLTPLSAASFPAGFSLVSNLGATSLAPGQSTSFTVRLDAIAAGTFSGSISLGNNDSDENPFDIVLQGSVTGVSTGSGASYRLNESGGTTALDSSGNGFHATYVNNPVLNQSGALAGDTAVSFNGTNQFVALPSGPFGNYGSTSSYTLSFETWFQAPSGASGVILGQTNGGTTPGIGRADSYVPALHLGTDGRLRSSLFWHGNPYARLLTGDGKRYDDGQWHHVAVTYAGGVETLYVDGAAIGQQSVPQSSYAGSYSYYLGTGFTDGWTAGNGGWHFFRGKLDEAAIHGRALSAAEVAEHYAAGAVSASFTRYVSPSGSDASDGSANAPWRTLQRAADLVQPGDTVVVRAGTYAGFDLRRDGTAARPITFRAEPGAVINARNAVTPDGINLEGADYVVIEGFTVNGMPRAGIRSVTNHHVVLRGNVADNNGYWGILTGFSDDILIEGNTTSRSQIEHGIYVSNSGDRPVVRNNVVWGNRVNGIHMNGGLTNGGDGIISQALVEGNVVYGNGLGGGSSINCDGVQGSTIRNNLVYDAHSSGISLYRIDGGGSSTGNLVVNNTVLVASDGRWALNIQNASTGNTVRNNILYTYHTSRGSIDISADSLPGFTSDYNVLMNRLTTSGGNTILTLAQWQAAGRDLHSLIATPSQLFVSPSTADFHLLPTSPAIDRGTPQFAPTKDLEGNARPAGGGWDIGAYERVPQAALLAADDLATEVDHSTRRWNRKLHDAALEEVLADWVSP